MFEGTLGLLIYGLDLVFPFLDRKILRFWSFPSCLVKLVGLTTSRSWLFIAPAASGFGLIVSLTLRSAERREEIGFQDSSFFDLSWMNSSTLAILATD